MQENVDISKLSWFKTKASTRYYFQVDSVDDVRQLYDIVDFSYKNNLNLLFVGWGTNLLFAFYEYDWIIVKNNLSWFDYNPQTKKLVVYSNEDISNVAEILEYKYGNNIWHRFIGLPWTVWWAVVGNAWCFWLQISNNFLNATLYDTFTWEEFCLDYEQMKFWYRDSLLKWQSRYFLVKAEFDLSQKIEKYHSDVDNIYFRKYKQPKWNSCWSFFKNPSKDVSSWLLLEKAWFKWYQYKDAFFSQQHANFLMTSKDYTDFSSLIYLKDAAQKTIYHKFNIWLEPEVSIISNYK